MPSFPKFRVTDENLDKQKELVLQTIEENRKKIETLLEKEPKTYENFVRPLQWMEEKLGFYFSPISHLNYVKNSPKTEEIYNALLPELSRYHTELGQNENIYQALKQILEEDLESEQRKVVEDMIIEFELSGVALGEKAKEELKQINIRLSELTSQFGQNLLKATDAYEMIVGESDVDGMPESLKEAAKCDEGYRFTLKQPSYIAYMTYGPNREKREKLYKAYVTRAPENEALIDEILALRYKKAKLLGFENYAQLSLETKMAASPEEVVSFLKDLAQKSRSQAKREFEALQAFAKEQGAEYELQAYDVAYWSEKLKIAKYHIDDEAYKPYFEKDATVNGLFTFLNKLFQLEFQEIDTPVWHESVKCYEISLPNRLVGRLYVDLEAREGKRGGAWMDEWVSHHIDQKGEIVYPVAYIVANFAPATKTTPSLLRPDDVVTLFHEMGHALHHLLSEVTEPAVSGIAGVEWDAVEFPSQFLENFAYEEEVLHLFAKHYQTGEPLSDEMIKRLKVAKNFQSAMAMVRQLEFGLFDMLVHMDWPVDVQKVLDEVREEVSVVPTPPYNKFQWGFSHIFAGGYAAGYYSYKWAEVLSADAFFMFVDNGIYNDEIAQSYLQEVLCKGGSRPAMESFKAFAGRAPNSEALLKLCGIQ
ncbi:MULTISPECIES: M3 family metallopeptidase [unclassified Nitratiruptor]|uniref:M3 family metallopeptidase n=1 Tax=unclassified Nitratiruptor TaxID=2624044 RepID=UPI0019162FAA|nr:MULTISPECIES: M3 family metallopeptidase [unclassified Nitratiruptor]BCD59830.1 oligopeptidase A [Nitratiruptor sp. YY08-10]BCD63754.1 oligopeptidase A [Nitratiruptor sp. YY08-14]